MMNEKTKVFKDKLIKLIRHEQIIKAYQDETEKRKALIYSGEEVLQEVLEFTRDFSLAFLPEVKRRRDLEAAQSLKKSWDSAKENYYQAQMTTRRFDNFSQQLQTDLEQVQEEKKLLIEVSGLSSEELEEILKEVSEELDLDPNKD